MSSWILKKKPFSRGDSRVGTSVSRNRGLDLLTRCICLPSIPTPNPPQPHDSYKSIVSNNAINQLIANMWAGSNFRASLPRKRLSRTPKVVTKNIEITTHMCMFKLVYFFPYLVLLKI